MEVVDHILSMCVHNNEAEDQSVLGCCAVCWVSSSDEICALLRFYPA